MDLKEKYMRFLIVFLALVLSPLGYAATMKGTNGVELLVIDGQKVKTSLFKGSNLDVEDGPHQFVVRYAKRMSDDSMVYSKPHIFSLEIIGNTEISVRRLNNRDLAENAVRRGLTWIVKSKQGTQKVSTSDILFQDGVQINVNVEKLVTAYNLEHGLDTSGQALSMKPDLLEKNAKTKTALLIDTYRSATLEERKAFRVWLIEQDLK